MAADFAGAFNALKPILACHATRFLVKTDTPSEYTLVTRSESPFHQHKGQPLYFGSVRLSKAYVSFHLMPLYIHPLLEEDISPALKKRMQGKTCFNFKAEPDSDLIAELQRLTDSGLEQWAEKNWL